MNPPSHKEASADAIRKYHSASSLTGASTSVLSQNPLLKPSAIVTFTKAKCIPLPYFEDEAKIVNLPYDDMMNKPLNTNTGSPLTLKTISCFLLHTCGVNSLKIAHLLEGGELYTVRANPSSGGLHPSEVYILLPPGLVAGQDGALVAHYQPIDHALQIRATIGRSVWKELNVGEDNIVICGTSLYWREVFKYGLRGFRYSLLDAGHLMAAAAVSAKILNWSATVLSDSTETFASLFGLNRSSDFPPQETHDFQFAMVVGPKKFAAEGVRVLSSQAPKFSWSGPALPISTKYHDEALHEVLDAARHTAFTDQVHTSKPHVASKEKETYAVAKIGAKVLASSIVMKRRSAHNFKTEKQEGVIQGSYLALHFIGCWKGRYRPHLHVRYGLTSQALNNMLTSAEALGRAQNFQNAVNLPSRACEKTVVCQPPGCPDHLHLYQLVSGSLSKYAAKISVSQSLCGFDQNNDIPHEIQQSGIDRYRTLHFEAGFVGQLLYLEATAISKGATGVGAFYDDAANSIFNGSAKTLYHFAVGQPTPDKRFSIPVDKLKSYVSAPAATAVVSTTCICGKCKAFKYCSPACQKSHWHTHKTSCTAPLNSFSEVAKLMASFASEQITSPRAASATERKVVKVPEAAEIVGKNKKIAYQDLPDTTTPARMQQVVQAMSLAAKSGLFDKPKNDVIIPPQTLFRFGSLMPVPESTRQTSKVPVEYFVQLQALIPPAKENYPRCHMLLLQALAIIAELGLNLNPALARPPANLTPKQLLARYKRLYEAVTRLTLASTMHVDGWEYYCYRALVFLEMREYDLAWQDCMRANTLVESGFTSNPPPNKFEYQQIVRIQELADSLAFDIGLVELQFFDDFDELLEATLHNTGTSHITDSSLKYQRASDVSFYKAWDLGIADKRADTAEFFRVLDSIPCIKTDVHGNKRVWLNFPAIMKSNYVNFTSHPTNSKDPRVSAWRSTIQWLENQILPRDHQPLTVEFLLELNGRCVANDGEALQYEREVWGIENRNMVESIAPVPKQFRQFHAWMNHGGSGYRSTKDNTLLVEIRDKFNSRKVTPANFEKIFSKEQQKLIAECYNELTPPDQIPRELQKLVDVANSEDFRKLHPVQRAAFLGLRLVCIHPFDNANGRTQQLLMGLELMREGYPPYVRRELDSYYVYLLKNIGTSGINMTCEEFSRWCAVSVALGMVGSDVSRDQLHAYANKLFVEKKPFDSRWSEGNLSLAPPAKLNASAITVQEQEPTKNYKGHWLHALSTLTSNTKVGNPNALPHAHEPLTIAYIDDLAAKNAILTGKWVLEVSEDHIDAVWQLVKKSVLSGALPRVPSAKTSTALGFGVPPHFYSHYVVCVYTKNYLDEDDVMEAAHALKQLLVSAGLKAGILAVHYKPGILTEIVERS